VGDSFTVTFDVEIDPAQVADPLENQAEGSGNGVDANGADILDSTGNPIAASDISDSGVDPTTSNPGESDDQQTSGDPTLFDPPPVPTGEISGVVFIDDNNDGIQQPGEAGISGVELTLTGTDVFGNAVTQAGFTDATGRYTFTELQAGSYTVTQTQPDDFTDGIDTNENGAITPVNDVWSGIELGFGQVIDSGTFGEQRTGASGNPPQFQGVGPLAFNPVSNLINGFGGSSPGTIYTGIPINGNADPLSLESGRPVTGGFALPAEELAGDECGSCEVDPCGNTIPVEQIIDDGCGCGPVGPQGQMQYEEVTVEGAETVWDDEVDSVSEAHAVEGEESEGGIVDQIDEDRSEEMANEDVIRKPSFLKRLSSWLNV